MGLIFDTFLKLINRKSIVENLPLFLSNGGFVSGQQSSGTLEKRLFSMSEEFFSRKLKLLKGLIIVLVSLTFWYIVNILG